MKYWEMLLLHQRARGKSGLTLPFLIGSQVFLKERKSVQGISDLILEIVHSNSFETCLRYCTDVQTLILEKRKPMNMVYYPTFKSEKQENLSVAIGLKENFGESVEGLIPNLISMFEYPIKNELFSAEPNVDKRSANWITFTDNEDVAFIKEAFKITE